MKKKIRIGCSGWSYAGDLGWIGKFYPKKIPSNKMFFFYSKIFDTVELNTTFYNLPKIRTVENWATNSPKEFLFSVKFPQDITHKKIGKEPAALQLRLFQTMSDISAEKNSTIILPVPTELLEYLKKGAKK